MESELTRLNDKLQSAVFLEDVFGKDIQSTFRFLVKVCHPDVCKEPGANSVFALLSDLREEAESSLKLGQYGKRIPRKKAHTNLSINLGSTVINLEKTLGSGVVSTVYQVDSSVKFCKVPRTPSNNDLIQREYDVLKILWQLTGNDKFDKFVEIQRKYVPKPLSIHATINDKSEKRLVSVYGMNDLLHYTIEDLLKMPKYSSGIDPADVFWIIRRLLMTLHLSHSKGYVHGSIHPGHVLVCPEGHGLTLVGWSSTAKINEQKVPIMESKYSEYVSPELKKGHLSHATTDLYSVAKLFFKMIGSQTIPNEIKSYMNRSLDVDYSKRCQLAFTFHEEFGDILKKTGYTGYHEMVV